MTIYQFMGDHPILTFFLAMIIAGCIKAPFWAIQRAIQRWIRHRNIVAQGWPPAHLDADGDFKVGDDN